MDNLENKLTKQQQKINLERQKLNRIKKQISATKRKQTSRIKYLLGFALLKRIEKGATKSRQSILAICQNELNEQDFELVEKFVLELPELSSSSTQEN